MWPHGPGACSTQCLITMSKYGTSIWKKIGVQPIALEDKNISQANVLKAIYEKNYIFPFV